MNVPKNASQHDTANLRSNMPQGLQKICTYGLQEGKIFYRGMPAVTWKNRVFCGFIRKSVLFISLYERQLSMIVNVSYPGSIWAGDILLIKIIKYSLYQQ